MRKSILAFAAALISASNAIRVELKEDEDLLEQPDFDQFEHESDFLAYEKNAQPMMVTSSLEESDSSSTSTTAEIIDQTLPKENCCLFYAAPNYKIEEDYTGNKEYLVEEKCLEGDPTHVTGYSFVQAGNLMDDNIESFKCHNNVAAEFCY